MMKSFSSPRSSKQVLIEDAVPAVSPVPVVKPQIILPLIKFGTLQLKPSASPISDEMNGIDEEEGDFVEEPLTAAEVAALRAATLRAAIPCILCKGVTAYRFCEVCLDAFCSLCWASIHRGGKLASHTSYAIQQPDGVGPDTDLPEVEYSMPRPEEVASAATTLGESLVFDLKHKYPEHKLSSAEKITRHQKQMIKATMSGGETGDRAELNIGDVGKFIAHGKKMGNLPISLQMNVSLLPFEDVVQAVLALTTIDAANLVGGWESLKRQPVDKWASAVTVTGAGLTLYR